MPAAIPVTGTTATDPFAGIVTVSCGHCHPKVVKAATEQLSKVTQVSGRHTTPAGTAELFRMAYGPTVRAFELLDEDRKAALAADLTAHWTRHHRATAAGTEVEAEFLELVAVRTSS